jgi:septum formation protein
MRLILASSSPRRAELLSAAGFTFDVRTVDVDERVRDGEAAADYVRRLASEKSARAAARGQAVKDSPAEVVLGADTAVVVDGRILGKPKDDADARAMLGLLSGRAHEVMTGVSVRSGLVEAAEVEVTTVWFLPLSSAEVDWYVASGEGRDKAGAYAVQGLASRFVPRIAGSYSNVVGLPVALVHELLRKVASPG